MGNTHGHRRRRTTEPEAHPHSHSNTHNSTPEDSGPVHVQFEPPDPPAEENEDDDDEEDFPVVFKWTSRGGQHPQSVRLCGSWDEWTTRIPMVKSNSDFTTIMNLNPGTYKYKYFVDGEWQLDTFSPRIVGPNETTQHTITIDESDFEVFNALDRDFAASNAGLEQRHVNARSTNLNTPNDREIEKWVEFTQTLPNYDDLARAPEPPSLEVGCMNYSLNDETPNSCDPNQLPEPNHVMLNHLYALSIKDKTMVLSTTHRHRRKYCTTIFYQPV